MLLFLPGAYREAVARGVRATVLRPVLALQAGAVERNARFDDPHRLRAERDSLAAFLVGHAALSTENRQLRDLLGLRTRLPPSFIPAEVVRIPGRGADGFFQLTAGSRQGVEVGAPIVSAAGLVGRVRNVDDRIAFGIDWMNPEFRASAMTVDGNIYGIVEPRRGPNGEPMLALTGTPRHVELETGAMIVTSGHGGVFPRGIPIGHVAGVEGEGTSWQRTYLVRPLVGPGEMTYVLVLGESQAEEEVRDLAATWGIRPTPPRVESDTMLAAGAGIPSAPRPAAARQSAESVRIPQPQVQGGPTRPTPPRPRLLGVPVQPQDTSGVQP